MADDLAVWIEGEHAGTLSRDRKGSLRFAYDETYRNRRGATPLSRSMPKQQAEYGDDVVAPWFDNLLPDDDEVRQRWATDFEAPSPSPFNLLEGMGIDCAGAVQVVPVGLIPNQTGRHEGVGEAEIEARLASLRRDVTSWNADDHGGRWSLGGAQGKFALARQQDGSWAAPSGRAASTHIFKVGVARFANADVAEFVSMRAAQHLGLSVAAVAIMQFGAQTALVVERYDRVIDPMGTRRFHQEDLCQALGRTRKVKYQNDGGPGVADVNKLISGLHPSDVAPSRELFVRSLIYNWLTAGVDAHAKNYSLLLVGDRARLAPLYDLTSGSLLLGPEKIFYKGKTAMKIGNDYRLRNIGRSDLQRCADEAGVDDASFMDIVDDYVARIPDAYERAVDEALDAGGALIAPGTRDRYLRGIGTTLDLSAGQAGLSRGSRIRQPVERTSANSSEAVSEISEDVAEGHFDA
ncbi:type II toxin-antitoxin system HipA family toxin [Pimelobacter simplex]|uniref:type II toxin-antitoxin system HipA family toxin n=1 Tax=Nocardioides simplex TaxID=2045 RepID=UPI0021503022|nr:type II toxin-antitoxin system HipA family toxin [Pimelobacter simplex]UUW90622.1 type II toxin-antitoxin system HipA family toxin [Pimelobacter simplex]UUW94451.1 type II toxin-antitoxin system HipA family toxin [Pimelobacter simplex]